MRLILTLLFIGCPLLSAPAASNTHQFLTSIPPGYHLVAYDDCGVEGRQPHVVMTNCYLWTFNTSDTDASPKERSAVFSYKGIEAVFDHLDPKLSYVLALTYASDHVYKRVQSLEANGVELHGPLPLPMAKATRVIVAVPAGVTRDGRMALNWKIHGEVNATVSIIELWANVPQSGRLQLTSIVGLPHAVQGQVLDGAYDAATNATVRVATGDKSFAPITAKTDTNGLFSFNRDEITPFQINGQFIFVANRDGSSGRAEVAATNLFLEPVHYIPMPSYVAGVENNVLLLDGVWSLNFRARNNVRSQSLEGTNWAAFKVPGQWLQQGFDIPPEQSVAVARNFTIPKSWQGQRLILRFDAIHAGTRYWLNGHELGYSENLFTPVEWDITDAARIGETNRLDLEMKTATVSEALSYSSAYAFHNLGGIDRSVRVFAIPQSFIRELRVDAALDKDFRDGVLRLHVGLDGASTLENRLTIALELRDPKGELVNISPAETHPNSFSGQSSVDLEVPVSGPLPWSAEKPALYHLTVKLRQAGDLIESIERHVGFRTIEVRGQKLYVNGRSVKLAGACHHEFDPLTGRADTMRHAETDVRLLKDANLNLIRTSHYPPTAELLDAADRLGMYVEVEAPFCWVGGTLDTSSNLFATLRPTSAMIDYHHAHPSVILWSIANESHFNPQFLSAAKMCKELDPTRPTTFNHDMAGSAATATATDIANIHYPAWPPDSIFAGDPRPLYFGEYFFPVCHEQTDVSIDPGLRELWGHGHAEPDSDFGRACAAELAKPPLKPGLKPGGWSMIYHSDRLLGGSIWASHDDAFYLSETNHAGYAWHHGFWGLIDCWRRPKPEWWLARHIFSPVWFETRHPHFVAGEKTIRIPIENRHVFTDLQELKFEWQIREQKGVAELTLPPSAKADLEIPLPAGVAEGDEIQLRVSTTAGTTVDEATFQLGQKKPNALPLPAAGAPAWTNDHGKIVITGNSFGLVLDEAKGDIDASDPRHNCPVISFPTVHVTRYDFGDLNGPNSQPYAVFPDIKTRKVEPVQVTNESTGLRLTVRERYEHFAGTTSWLIDSNGNGFITSDYTYNGPAMDARETGVRLLVNGACDEITWRRWSEWGAFPGESISRTTGTAKAHRNASWGAARWNERPAWPWSQDETELGTADFRSVKFNIYEASLAAPNGAGISVHANADTHFRAALDARGVIAHVLTHCAMGQFQIKSGDRLKARYVVTLSGRRH